MRNAAKHTNSALLAVNGAAGPRGGPLVRDQAPAGINLPADERNAPDGDFMLHDQLQEQ